MRRLLSAPSLSCFFGPLKLEPRGRTGWRIAIPLVVLSILALFGGFVEIPPYLGNVPAFSELMKSALPAPRAPASAGSDLEFILSAIAAVVAVLGVAIAYIAFRRRPAFLEALVRLPPSLALQHFWENDWGFDWLYDRGLVRPFLWIARIDQGDVIDRFSTGVALLSRAVYRQLSKSENGRVRHYPSQRIFQNKPPTKRPSALCAPRGASYTGAGFSRSPPLRR